MNRESARLNINQLAQFIHQVAVFPQHIDRQLLTPQTCNLMQWHHFFTQQLGFIVSPCHLEDSGQLDAPLLLAMHSVHGPVLIKSPPSMLRDHNAQLLLLQTGKSQPVLSTDMEKMSYFSTLVDSFDWKSTVTSETLADYIYHPMASIMRQYLSLNFVVSLLISLLFIAGMDTLNFIVPSQSLNDYFTVSILVIAAMMTFFISKYIMFRANIWIESVANERTEHLYLSMLWAITHNNHVDLSHFSASVSELAKLKSSLKITTSSCIALIPLLIVVFIRMPLPLVLTPIILSAAVGFIQMAKKKHCTAAQNKQLQLIQDGQLALQKVINDIKATLYYSRFNQGISTYLALGIEAMHSGKTVAEIMCFNEQLNQFMLGLAMCVAILISGYLIGNGSTEPMLSIGSAYMILYLISTIFKAIPRLTTALELRDEITASAAAIQVLIAASSSELSSNNVRSSHIEIEFNRLVLPHGCRFQAGEHLSERLSETSIIDVRGKSGSGKSTLLRCLLGLTLPMSGEITIAGIQANKLSQKERHDLYVYMGQDSRLVIGSLRDNITLLCGHLVDNRTIWAVLEKVQLLSKIQSLPLGLDTPVMSSGSAFSTGERQRILLAQVLLKPAQILILDEAMSGLPESMERMIINAIRGDYRYLIRVSHRAALHDMAEHVILLGEPAENGG